MLLFIKEILPNILVDFLLMTACVAAIIGCSWLVYMSIDSLLELRRQRKEEKEERERIERMANNDNA